MRSHVVQASTARVVAVQGHGYRTGIAVKRANLIPNALAGHRTRAVSGGSCRSDQHRTLADPREYRSSYLARLRSLGGEHELKLGLTPRVSAGLITGESVSHGAPARTIALHGCLLGSPRRLTFSIQ